MNEANDAGFNGTVKVNNVGATITFRNGESLSKLKEHADKQPCDEFFWCRLEKMLLYRNPDGKFFKMNFEEIEL